MEAQKKTNTVIGEYYLQGVMETASGFKLNSDSTFQFFYSYGSLDRSGSGTCIQEGNHIILNSKPGSKGFSLIKSNTVADNIITIKITEANQTLRSHVYAVLASGNNQLDEMTTQNGNINFTKMAVDSIKLILEFCPEKFLFS